MTKQKAPRRAKGDRGGWNIKQASAWSGIGENTLRTWCKAEKIPCAYRIGRRILLPVEGFKRWFNDHNALELARPEMNRPTA